MSNTTHGYYVLGWLASVRYDPLADLYEAWVPQHPNVLTIGKSRSEALSELRERLAEEVGVNPGVCEEVNWGLGSGIAREGLLIEARGGETGGNR